LEAELDDQLAHLKIAMEEACQADNLARSENRPAIQKLKLLPEVMAMLNRNTHRDTILDPEVNFLQAIRFFLEPLADGSLPSYNIQRDIFTALCRLPIDTELLLSSELGKIVFFYTKSKKPELNIKRMAERLMGEWSRPILKRTHNYKERHVETRDYDYRYVFASRAVPFFVFLTNVASEPPSSARPPAPPSSLSRSVRPHHNSRSMTLSASASLRLLMLAATVPVSRVCPRRTPLHPRAPSTLLLAAIAIARLALVAMMPSAS
jgi:transcription factor SPN1